MAVNDNNSEQFIGVANTPDTGGVPIDVLSKIFAELSVHDLSLAALVARQWKNIILNNDIPSRNLLWLEVIKNEFSERVYNLAVPIAKTLLMLDKKGDEYKNPTYAPLVALIGRILQRHILKATPNKDLFKLGICGEVLSYLPVSFISYFQARLDKSEPTNLLWSIYFRFPLRWSPHPYGSEETQPLLSRFFSKRLTSDAKPEDYNVVSLSLPAANSYFLYLDLDKIAPEKRIWPDFLASHRCDKLVCLHLVHSGISLDNMYHDLDQIFFDALRRNPHQSVTSLVFVRGVFSDASAQALAGCLLNEHCQIDNLNLNSCKFTKIAQLKYILEALSSSRVTHLNLSYICLDCDWQAEDVSTMFARLLGGEHSSLQHLILPCDLPREFLFPCLDAIAWNPKCSLSLEFSSSMPVLPMRDDIVKKLAGMMACAQTRGCKFSIKVPTESQELFSKCLKEAEPELNHTPVGGKTP